MSAPIASFRPDFAAFARAKVTLLAIVSLVGCEVDTLPRARSAPDARRSITLADAGPQSGGRDDAPEISRSMGAAGGIVVLWPRVLPRSDAPADLALAKAAQRRLEQLARRAATKVDVRPEPERVCPRPDGCRALALGAVLARSGAGCALVATVARPGAVPSRLVPWAGEVALKSEEAEFRSPPESLVTVREFVPCKQLSEELEANAAPGDEAKVLDALAAALSATDSSP